MGKRKELLEWRDLIPELENKAKELDRLGLWIETLVSFLESKEDLGKFLLWRIKTKTQIISKKWNWKTDGVFFLSYLKTDLQKINLLRNEIECFIQKKSNQPFVVLSGKIEETLNDLKEVRIKFLVEQISEIFQKELAFFLFGIIKLIQKGLYNHLYFEVFCMDHFFQYEQKKSSPEKLMDFIFYDYSGEKPIPLFDDYHSTVGFFSFFKILSSIKEKLDCKVNDFKKNTDFNSLFGYFKRIEKSLIFTFLDLMRELAFFKPATLKPQLAWAAEEKKITSQSRISIFSSLPLIIVFLALLFLVVFFLLIISSELNKKKKSSQH